MVNSEIKVVLGLAISLQAGQNHFLFSLLPCVPEEIQKKQQMPEKGKGKCANVKILVIY